MSTWATIFLGVIAVATLVTALLQVALLVSGFMLARRLMKFVDDLERDIRPIIGHVSSIARDASRVASLAVAQVERADEVITDFFRRVEQMISHLQGVITTTLREGNALLIGLRAVMAAIRAFRGRQGRRRSEDDEALFI